MPMGQLTQVLRDVNPELDPRLLVGPQSVDDAGVVLLGPDEGAPDGLALVQTVDYFPPVLDDPYLYGAVAAANALSDVYAMGGRPISALNLAGFPADFDEGWIRDIFRGGFDKVREAGAVIAGGHTVRSDEPLFGFAVTGVVDRDQVADNQGAQVGDRLVLTKPLGMGTMSTAGKFQKAPAGAVRAAALVMATLNDKAAEAMNAVGVNACTDVTGFGLVGHGRNIAAGSGVTLRLSVADLPIFEGALDLARSGVVSGGSQRNRDSLAGLVGVADGLDEALVSLIFDAETSGGLLISVAEGRLAQLQGELAERDVLAAVVGEIADAGEHLVELC